MSKARKQRAIARALRSAARDLAQDAATLEIRAKEADSLAQHHERMADIPRALTAVKNATALGKPESEAIREAARIWDFPPGTLAAHWDDARRRDGAVGKWIRDREILRLAWTGATNDELSARFGMHPKSVSRIIARRLRATKKPIKPAHEGNPPCLPNPAPASPPALLASPPSLSATRKPLSPSRS